MSLGGIAFTAAVLAIALIGLFELYNLLAGMRPLRWAGYAGVAATISLTWLVDERERGVALGLGLCLVLSALAGLILARREEVTIRVGLTFLGAAYLGLPMALLVATRELPNGAQAVANVLVGTWAFDTFSYFGGRAWGSRPIAPRISPSKTVEGFAAGVVGGTLSVWIAGLYMDWIGHLEAVALGVVICVVAYVGDLFESMVKRDVQVKESGRLLAGHGGVLDRFDAMLFTSVAGYFATVWLV